MTPISLSPLGCQAGKAPPKIAFLSVPSVHIIQTPAEPLPSASDLSYTIHCPSGLHAGK